MNYSLIWLEHLLLFILLFAIVFSFARYMRFLFGGMHMDFELTSKDNLAVAITLAGYYLGVTVIFLGAYIGPTKGLWKDFGHTGGYAIFGIVLLNFTEWINDKLLLRKLVVRDEILKKKNLGVAAVEAGMYLATGLIIAGAIHGEGGGLVSALLFFVIAQIVFILMGLFYEWITPYSVNRELKKRNHAAGLGFSGILIGTAILLMKGISGDLAHWQEHFTQFALSIITIFIAIPIVRFYFDKLIIPASDLEVEIERDRNYGAGLLEGVVVVCFSLILFFIS